MHCIEVIKARNEEVGRVVCCGHFEVIRPIPEFDGFPSSSVSLERGPVFDPMRSNDHFAKLMATLPPNSGEDQVKTGGCDE